MGRHSIPRPNPYEQSEQTDQQTAPGIMNFNAAIRVEGLFYHLNGISMMNAVPCSSPFIFVHTNRVP